MTLPQTAPDLVRWTTPFTDKLFPSVSTITQNGGDTVTLVVAPDGIYEYPKYAVRFEHVIAFLSHEEAFAFDRGYGSLTRSEDKLCAYLWVNSEWLKAYEKGVAFISTDPMRHYLLFGGDSNVELISDTQPRIERIDTNTFLEVKHEV